MVRLRTLSGPSAAAPCLTFKILLHLGSLYKIDRRAVSKNRILGNYLVLSCVASKRLQRHDFTVLFRVLSFIILNCYVQYLEEG